MPSPSAPLTIEAVNAFSRDAFVDRFGAVFESTPALAGVAWAHRPFIDRAALIAAFAAAADDLDAAGVLALLRAHPELATPAPLADHSRDEQRSAGLTALDQATRDRIRSGNAAYLSRFGFPFIVAVRGLTPEDIADALTERLGHDQQVEEATALVQVKRIAGLRIEQLVGV